MGTCRLCGKRSIIISDVIGFCANCIREHPQETLKPISLIRYRERSSFGLPHKPPKGGNVRCSFCVNQCELNEGELGFCGRFVCKNGKIKINAPSPGLTALTFYHDPLPTNCVASWICPASTSEGYPEFTCTEGPEVGFKNLAVFYQSCNFDCFYCQNWHFRDKTTHRFYKSEDVVDAVDEKTNCICFFGGDPTPNILNSLDIAEKACNLKKEFLRICWETNGSVNWKFLERALSFAMKTGGCIKFDLKFFSKSLNLALCGTDNSWTLDNFKKAALLARKRPHPPLVIASTLLVPGYVDSYELEGLASIIASVNKDIPWSFLAFYPTFILNDLPTTSWDHAKLAERIAKKYGIKNINIGNVHLLSNSYKISP